MHWHPLHQVDLCRNYPASDTSQCQRIRAAIRTSATRNTSCVQLQQRGDAVLRHVTLRRRSGYGARWMQRWRGVPSFLQGGAVQPFTQVTTPAAAGRQQVTRQHRKCLQSGLVASPASHKNRSAEACRTRWVPGCPGSRPKAERCYPCFAVVMHTANRCYSCLAVVMHAANRCYPCRAVVIHTANRCYPCIAVVIHTTNRCYPCRTVAIHTANRCYPCRTDPSLFFLNFWQGALCVVVVGRGS